MLSNTNIKHSHFIQITTEEEAGLKTLDMILSTVDKFNNILF